MTRLLLRIYVNPGEAHIFSNLLRKDGSQETTAATIDTGAAISLFPAELLELVAYRPIGDEKIIIDQAGIANQSFEAVEAFVTISLEDEFGHLTQPFEIPAWLADSAIPLLGFAGVLDRAILHIDMPQQVGWIEIDA